VIWRIVNSPFGNVLKAIREHEQRAISLGYNVDRYKLGAFVISGSLAGLAGGSNAIVFQLASLTDVSWTVSGEVVFMTLLGGIGTLLGPVVGATLIIVLETVLATSDLPAQVVLGGVFVLCVMLFRRGIVGEIEARLRKTSS
jgi:branched-chain amino acid transport system permease protein